MYAIKVKNILGEDWKYVNPEYSGYKQQFEHNGVEYLPLDTCIKYNRFICAGDIEEIER